MKFKIYILQLWLVFHFTTNAQQKTSPTFNAGFLTLRTVDSTRIYKPDTTQADSLHFRPLELDIWYPSLQQSENRLSFGQIFGLNEKRASMYKEGDFTGITEEYAQFFAASLGMDPNEGLDLLSLKTDSYKNTTIAPGQHPVIMYMAGYNGMGYENYKILERLAQNGFIVVSVWSMGLYPGYMSNRIFDTMEQVLDGEMALKIVMNDARFDVDSRKIGLLGCSWGGMSAAILLNRHPEIKAMATLDGSEVVYYGDTEEEDVFLKEIVAAKVLRPEKVNAAYLYMESGNKWDGFTPTGEYHYFKQLNSPKYYLRHTKGMHEDFTCIPSLLHASDASVLTYGQITESTLVFFDAYLNGNSDFEGYHKKLISEKHITDRTYAYRMDIPKNLVLEGTVSDGSSNAPLPYVNIGVLNKDRGTVSNTDGYFQLELNESHLSDTLRISRVGYAPKTVLVKSLMNRKEPYTIVLDEEVSALNEVVVTAKAWKYKTIGNKTKSKFLSTGFAYDMLGAELGLRINIGRKPTYVRAFNFHVSYNRLSAKAIFRLNIYALEGGKPGKNLLNENVLIPIAAGESGVFSVDLKKHDLVLNDDVIVMLEWVEAAEGQVKTGEGIFLSLGMFTNGTYTRTSSQGKIKKFRGLGVGYNLDVRY